MIPRPETDLLKSAGIEYLFPELSHSEYRIQMGNMVGVLWVSCSCSLVLAVSMGKVTTSAVMAAMPLPNIN